MGCKIKFLTLANGNETQEDEVETLSDGKKKVRVFDIGEVSDEKAKSADLSIDDVTEEVMKLDENSRVKLADFIRDARYTELSEKDVQNFHLIGNMSVEDIFTSFGIRKEWIPLSDESMNEHFNIVKCRSLSLPGRTVSGRIVDGMGRVIYVLRNQNDAECFLQYLRAKQSVNELSKKKPDVYKEIIDNHAYELSAIKQRIYGEDSSVSPQEMLLEFLDNTAKFNSFRSDGRTIDTRNVFNEIYNQLTGEYYKYYIAKYDAFENDVDALKADRYDYKVKKIPKAGLYEVIRRHVDDFSSRYSLDRFVNLNNEELNELFYGNNEKGVKGIFADHALLRMSKIKDVDATKRSETEESENKTESLTSQTVSEGFVKTNWNAIVSGAADETAKSILQSEAEKTRKVKVEGKNKTEKYVGMKYETYSDFKSDETISLKDKAELINKAGFTFTDSDGETRLLRAKYSERTEDETAVKKDSEGKTVIDPETGKPVREKTGKSVLRKKIEFYYERPKKTRAGKIDASYITFTFPYELAGKRYGFDYNTKYVLSAVDGVDAGEYGVINDGKYHGMFVYYYTDPDSHRTEYVISRDIMSPYAGINRFKSLNLALEGIDRENMYDKLSDRALISIKQRPDGVPRYFNELELREVNNRQVLTVLDYELETKKSYSDLPDTYKSLFDIRGRKFHEYFDEATNNATKKLYTPEMMSVFLMKMYYDIYVANKAFNPKEARSREEAVEKIISNYNNDSDKWKAIINSISEAGVKNYFVEKVYSKYSSGLANIKLRELYENGVTLDVTGERFQKNGREVGKFVTGAIDMGIDFIKKQYNVNVVKTDSEALSSDKFYIDNGLDKKGLGIYKKPDSTAAFIHDGKIYINMSVATASDIWHEVAHLFFGALKATDFELYNEMLESFRQKGSFYHDRFAAELAHVNRHSEYANMARSDRYEEAAARMIGNYLYNNMEFGNIYETNADSTGEVSRFLKSTAGFNEEVYEKVMSDIIKSIQGGFAESADVFQEGNSLGFTKLMKYLSGRSSGKSDEAIDYNTAANIVKQLIAQDKDMEQC